MACTSAGSGESVLEGTADDLSQKVVAGEVVDKDWTATAEDNKPVIVLPNSVAYEEPGYWQNGANAYDDDTTTYADETTAGTKAVPRRP